MKKKKAIIFSIAAVILVLIAGTTLYWCYFSDYSNVLKINWGFSLPRESHYLNTYSHSSGASFTGDGIRYHVFSCENIDPIDKMFAWQLTEQETNYYSSYSTAVDEWLDKINVPPRDRPDYGDCSYWYQSQDDGSEIIIFWDIDQGKLYVVESFL